MRIKRDKLDILFSKLVKLRAEGICEYCGRLGNQTSHFHSRRKRATRWDLDNSIWACFSCHMHLQENPYQHTEFFKKRLGSKRFEELNIRAEILVKIDRDAIEKILREKIKEVESARSSD